MIQLQLQLLPVPHRFRGPGRFRAAGQTIYFEHPDDQPTPADVVLRFFTTEEEATWIAEVLNRAVQPVTNR